MNDKPKKMSRKNAIDLMKKRFANLVGMTTAKARVQQIILSALVDDYIPPIAILATKGLGKTKLLMIILSLIRDVLGRRVVWFARGEDCGTRLKMVEECFVPQIHDHDAGLGIDEVHEWKPNVQSLVRSLVEITAERKCKTVRAIGDAEITWNPLRNFIVIATNKREKLDVPTLDRFEVIHLPLYSLGEMKAIVEMTAKKMGVKMDKRAIEMIAECNRGNARDVVKWCDCAKAHCNDVGKKSLDAKGALAVIKTREMFMGGVNRDELNTLLLLENAKFTDAAGEMQLKELAGANNVTSAEQNANETYLRMRQLIRTRGTRSLTTKGQDYLNELRKLNFIPKLANRKPLPVSKGSK